MIAQRWAERHRRILLIVPASLRKQWSQELFDKFSLPSVIIESKSYNQAKKDGITRPFEQPDKVVITSYEFAATKAEDIAHGRWALVVCDEAHRLRNVYKQGLSATAIGSAVNLSWIDNSGVEAGFRLERKVGLSGVYAPYATLGPNMTNFVDTGVVTGNTYFYRVLAFNQNGNSSFSNEAGVTVQQGGGSGGGVLAAPSNLTATGEVQAVSLFWSDNSMNEVGSGSSVDSGQALGLRSRSCRRTRETSPTIR